ncbi:MAG: zinc-finger domain-containing protein [Proteobacteria bacterium]|nr:zinc-finger domain-containing protein [Pseudomonadota bacterium]
MASGATPHFHNSMGVATIEIGAKEFMCIGARSPYDHPHVFLDMGNAGEIICPYCSTLYRYNKKLAAGAAVPSEAVWQDEAA